MKGSIALVFFSCPLAPMEPDTTPFFMRPHDSERKRLDLILAPFAATSELICEGASQLGIPHTSQQSQQLSPFRPSRFAVPAPRLRLVPRGQAPAITFTTVESPPPRTKFIPNSHKAGSCPRYLLRTNQQIIAAFRPSVSEWRVAENGGRREEGWPRYGLQWTRNEQQF